MSSCKVIESDGLDRLYFPFLSGAGLVHGVFSRYGGVSSPPYDSLNTSYGVGDGDGNVIENRERIKKVLGIGTLVSARQIHGKKVFDACEFKHRVEIPVRLSNLCSPPPFVPIHIILESGSHMQVIQLCAKEVVSFGIFLKMTKE